MKWSNIIPQVEGGDIFGEESSKSLVDILSEEGNERGLDLCSVHEWVGEWVNARRERTYESSGQSEQSLE